LDANNFSGAITMGEQAVQLAPHVGQYHATLGRAYDFSGFASQAEQEFHRALALDPDNSLARALLSFKHTGADLRIALTNYAQAFLSDPAIPLQLMRGGVDSDLQPRG